MLAGQWELFLKMIVPKDAERNQVVETRRAFYAGAEAVMRIMKEIGDRPEIDEDRGVKVLESMDQELREFGRAIAEGRA